MGLESLNEMLTDLKAEIVFRQQRLQVGPSLPNSHTQLRPPIEEIRARYYRELKRFVTIPETFRGLTDTPLFSALLGRAAAGFAVVYRKAEAMFAKLSRSTSIFRDYVVLGMVDVDELVGELTEVAEWDHNFRMVKTRGREAEKLPSSIKVRLPLTLEPSIFPCPCPLLR